VGLLGIALQNALNPALVTVASPAYTNYNELLQQYLLIPAGISDIFGESDLLLQSKDYFSTAPHDTSLGKLALETLLSLFSSGHNLGTNAQPTARTRNFSDMGVLASSGEVAVTGRSMLSLMKYLSGADTSNPVLSTELMDEATKVLWSGTAQGKEISMAYATGTEKLSDGTDYFHKDGLTSTGYQSYIAWSKQDRAGVFVIINSKSDGFVDLENNMVKQLVLIAK